MTTKRLVLEIDANADDEKLDFTRWHAFVLCKCKRYLCQSYLHFKFAILY